MPVSRLTLYSAATTLRPFAPRNFSMMSSPVCWEYIGRPFECVLMRQFSLASSSAIFLIWSLADSSDCLLAKITRITDSCAALYLARLRELRGL